MATLKLAPLCLVAFSIISGCKGTINKECFPSTFKFGSATSAYQIEGAYNEDGKTPSIVDLLFSYLRLDIDLSSGKVAADSYHKYRDDVEMVKNLKSNHYRFSIAWSRILPKGTNDRINPLGVQYYRNLIDLLVKNGIEPIVTLYHWDLPQVFLYMGQWSNEQLVLYFTNYAKVAFELFGDKVKRWITFNEPYSFCYQAEQILEIIIPFYPKATTQYLCTHTVIKAHAATYRMYQKLFRESQKGVLSMALNLDYYAPANNTPEDIEAANRRMLFQFGVFLHPLVYGDYPDIVKKRMKYRSLGQNLTYSRLPEFTNIEKSKIKGSYDFIGLNHYTTFLTAPAVEAPFDKVSIGADIGVTISQNTSWERSPSVATTNYVVPWGIRGLLNWINKNYPNNEIFITENGYAGVSGLDDPRRSNYFKEYLRNVALAINEDKINVTGYTAWSLMDNFEWVLGYQVKYGLYQVDFKSRNRTRTARKSAECYKNITVTGCVDSCVFE